MITSLSITQNEPDLNHKQRVRSVDLLRGGVMILMAVDLMRVYSGIPAGVQTAAVFFTRWITRFCVLTFVFLPETSAFFYGRKVNDRRSNA